MVIELHLVETFSNRKPDCDYCGRIYVNPAQINYFKYGRGFDLEHYCEKANLNRPRHIDGKNSTYLYFNFEDAMLHVAESPSYIKKILESF